MNTADERADHTIEHMEAVTSIQPEQVNGHHSTRTEAIRRRAQALYDARDGSGETRTALDDWLEAEREIDASSTTGIPE